MKALKQLPQWLVPLGVAIILIYGGYSASQEENRREQLIEDVKKAICGQIEIEKCDLQQVLNDIKLNNANQTDLLLAQGRLIQCLLAAHDFDDTGREDCRKAQEDFTELERQSQATAQPQTTAPGNTNQPAANPGQGGDNNVQPQPLVCTPGLVVVNGVCVTPVTP